MNLGDPMLDGCGYFLRTVLFLVFAVTQLTLDLYVSSFLEFGRELVLLLSGFEAESIAGLASQPPQPTATVE